MNGIVVVDKPPDVTSAQTVAEVKRLLKAKKVGHTGTLDPFATGVLVCCINQATRLAQFLTQGEKSYEAVMRLGVRTDTQDLTGRTVSRVPALTVTDYEIRSAFRDFLNIKEQAPPAFSALKYHGVPLYKLARKGSFVQKPSRPVSILHLDILDIDLPFVRFEVTCSQGTYIRTLCADMGDALGCGAHLVKLCRTQSGGFTTEEAMSLDALEKRAADGKASSCVIPMNNALRGIPEIQAGRELAREMLHGQPVTQDKLGLVGDPRAHWIKVIDSEGDLVAVLDASRKNGIFPYMCVFPKAEIRSPLDQGAGTTS